jgi:D-3-phosphoglycerate dehydrogenase
MTPLGRVIFVDSVHQILWERLIKMNWECHDKTHLNANDISPLLDQYEGIVIRSKIKLTAEILSKCRNLKFIARAGSGLENIDLDFCSKNNIHVFSSPEGNRDAVAEHAMGMLLMLNNHLKRVDQQVREGVWIRAENRGFELKGKTIALMGYGVMANAFAQRLKGFDVTVLAYDKFKTNFSDEFAKEATLEEIYAKADILSIHTNYHTDNKYLVNHQFIQSFKKAFILINTARGFNVNTTDLVNGLKSKKIIGACLDVLEYESVSFETVPDIESSEALRYLGKAENVIFSPHIAGWTYESHFKLSNVLADKIEHWIAN